MHGTDSSTCAELTANRDARQINLWILLPHFQGEILAPLEKHSSSEVHFRGWMFLDTHICPPTIPFPPSQGLVAPQPSAHLPCCRDESSSISSPATLCEEKHKLVLQAGGPCCTCLLPCLSPECHAQEQGLVSHREHRATHQRCGTTGRDGGVSQAGNPARPSFCPCPKHCWAPPGSWGKLSSDRAAGQQAFQPHSSQRCVWGTGSSCVLPHEALWVNEGSQDLAPGFSCQAAHLYPVTEGAMALLKALPMSQKPPPQKSSGSEQLPSRPQTYFWRAGLSQDQLTTAQCWLQVGILGELLFILLVDWGRGRP